MIFEYQAVQTFSAQIEIDDIGNCCLLSRDGLDQERYLYIFTVLGETQIIKYGPILPELEQLPLSVTYSYSRFDYSDAKIEKEINKFIQDANQVELTTLEYIKDNIRNLIDCIETYDEVCDNQLGYGIDEQVG